MLATFSAAQRCPNFSILPDGNRTSRCCHGRRRALFSIGENCALYEDGRAPIYVHWAADHAAAMEVFGETNGLCHH